MIASPDKIPQLKVSQVSLAATVGMGFLLQDISFEVLAGERVAIVGPSGAGKTSLLRLLNRLNEASSGKILLENQDIRQIPPTQLRQQVTLVLQEGKLLGMTVQEAISYPLLLRGFSATQVKERLFYWLERLHIPEDWQNRTEIQLSAGQRQLVAIARALVIQPKILLLDEPTSALDSGRASHLIQILTQIPQEFGTTILMVNHQLELAQQFSTKVLHLQQGKLVDFIASERLDWKQLRQTFIDLERREAEEW
ncbi:ATP-binding cassette domain-containing protein [Floridanema evergladense]|uniref:ATP-binding cassette domain-containing protein n=1 Tax=Floridaenema evergladense BLCC-F167 TaxID=3153639 RepID=A0ABV4WK31_9CYAN